MQTIESKEQLLTLIPKLAKVPSDRPPEFYANVAKNFMLPVKDELELDAKIDDLINEIESFRDQGMEENNPRFNRMRRVWAKKAVKSFVDSKIFATKLGRQFLIEQIEIAEYSETTPFEEYVLDILLFLARRSFVFPSTLPVATSSDRELLLSYPPIRFLKILHSLLPRAEKSTGFLVLRESKTATWVITAGTVQFLRWCASP